MSRSTDVAVVASATFACTPDELFGVVEDDENFFALRPTAIEHNDVTPLPNGGHSCTQVYAVGRRRIVQRSRTVQRQPGALLVEEAETRLSRINGIMEFVPVPEGVLLTIRSEMTYHRKLGRLAKYFVARGVKNQLCIFFELLGDLVARKATPHDDGAR